MCVFIRIRERERKGESTGEKGRKDRCKDRRVGGRKERIKEGKKECFIMYFIIIRNKKSLFPKYDSTTQL